MSSGDRVAASAGVEAPESTAERVALWRALHLLVDEAPQVIEDGIGLQLLDPDPQWRSRPDMDPAGTRGFRASIVSRARFIEDLVAEQAERGTRQYVLLGAGLDTLAQRRPELASSLRVFEVDQPGAQAWKRRRLVELGYGIPEWLRLVPVDFEADGDWWQRLVEAGFDPGAPALVASTGVTMYLSEEDLPAAARPSRRPRPRGTAVIEARRPGVRHTVHQLLPAGADARDGS